MCFPNEICLLNLNNMFADMEVGEMVGLFACFFFNSAGRLLISVEKTTSEIQKHSRGKGSSSEMDKAAP